MLVALVLGRFKPIEKRGLSAVILFSAAMLVLRLLLAQPFWRSGLTRWVDFPSGFLTQLSGSTVYLFSEEFRLHFFWGAAPVPFPVFAGYVTAVAEILLPVLLLLGLLTRLGALALLAMAMVVQLVFPDGLVNAADPMNSHALWMLYAAAIAICGPGIFSLDTLIRRFGHGQQRTRQPAEQTTHSNR